jgi:hypothetical protein
MVFRQRNRIGICHIACDIFQCVYNGFLSEGNIMSYYTVNVEILVKSDNQDNARDIIENYIDDLVSNNNDLQDYSILICKKLKESV